MKFKVSILRNGELAYPYFDHGAYGKLEDAVNVMSRLQLGRMLSTDEISKIVALLDTLTGEHPSFKLPILPPS